ncbi:MAG: hemerythrin family protein [Gammaproteobacteria bacterium]|nr:hemerythrin family protein [Gammaproteobacteria bacterium]
MHNELNNNNDSPQCKKSIVKWSDDFSYDVQEMDNDHKVMIELINRMQTITSENNTEFDIKTLLAKLAEYAILHFRREEIVMKTCQYPDYDEHVAFHHELEIKVFELLKQKDKIFTAKEIDELLQFLSDWLFGHISTVDQIMKPYVANYINEIDEALVGTTPVPSLD